MDIQITERRQAGAQAGKPSARTASIRESLRVQRQSGTVSAIEYLKSAGVGGAVIQRVLSGAATRSDDR